MLELVAAAVLVIYKWKLMETQFAWNVSCSASERLWGAYLIPYWSPPTWVPKPQVCLEGRRMIAMLLCATHWEQTSMAPLQRWCSSGVGRHEGKGFMRMMNLSAQAQTSGQGCSFNWRWTACQRYSTDTNECVELTNVGASLDNCRTERAPNFARCSLQAIPFLPRR